VRIAGLAMILAAVSLALLTTGARADDRDLVVGSILGRGSDPRTGAEAAGRAPGDVLSTVSGADSFPISCATPIVLALTRPDAPLAPSLQQALAILVARPASEQEKIAVTRDGRFAVHYPGVPRSSGLVSTDRDGNGLPDLVDRVSEALAASRSVLSGRLGYPSPVSDGERLDVFLSDLGHGLEGYAVPRAGGLPPFIVLDGGLSADRVTPATLHQVAHATLLSMAPRAPRWWAEASAAYLTLTSTGDLKAHEASLRLRLQSPGRGLASDSLMLMEGGLLWPLFLAERAGDPGVVRQIWEEMAVQTPDPPAATDLVLRRYGLTLGDAHREFSAWNEFTGDRDDGQHFSLGRSLPTALLPAAGPDAPFRIDPIDPVEPLGSAAFRIAADGRPGALDLDVETEGGRPGADLLIFYRVGAALPVLVPIALDAAGTGRVSVPWADTREAWIVLRNDALPGAGGAARFEVRGSSDPYAPYDLASFTATDSGPSVLLEWTTASEKGLAAWNIYRSETPGGPFSRLNQVAVPAVGNSAADTGYIFVDGYVRPGRRYYYLVEGLTTLGLPQRSQVVSARVPPAR